jgi:glutathione S-transferase
MALILTIGSKRWSSWSLRPWLALKQAAIPFEERLIPLRQPDTKPRILEYSPSGKVPLLIDGDILVWDSLAILDYIAVRFPDAGLWPRDLGPLALARSISAEMHSGFAPLRRELPMDIASRLPLPDLSDEAMADIARVQAIWRDARARFGGTGPFLFGAFTNADAMFAPVASRFQTYGVALDPVCEAYVKTIMSLPAIVEWSQAASKETI